MDITAITPYCLDKNYGRSLNQRIASEPDGWICLRDSDCCFLTPDYGRQIAEVCGTTDYDILGCITNRLGRPIQRHTPEMSQDWDMQNHYRIAKERERDNWGQVEDITPKKFVAGMLMLFRKSTWEKVKFKENCITWDDQFSMDVTTQGGKLGLMTGLYMFHLYRIWADYPMFANQHLVNK